MTCYMRHMDWLFEALDLPKDAPNKKAVDAALRDEFGLGGDGCKCPEVWSALKALSDEERVALVPAVRERLG